MAARSCYQHYRRRRYFLASLTSLAFSGKGHIFGQRTLRTATFALAYNPTPVTTARSTIDRGRHGSICSASTAALEIGQLMHHRALWDASEPLSKARRKLKPRHRGLFAPSTDDARDTDNSDAPSTDDAPDTDNSDALALFNEFCTVLCDTGVMPRKEIFETWSAALHIHETFGDKVRRVCDVAAGHSLLAWALLVLDDHDDINKHANEESKPLTVLCVDRRMPQSAETIRLAMIDRWPHLADRFDFVEGSLEQIQQHPSSLLASVHACGGLSDLLIASAASSSSPIALVPCCHTRKRKALLGASAYARAEYDAIINAEGKVKDLATMLDEARETALRNAGFEIYTQFLPKQFTLKNRLIMGMPKAVDSTDTCSNSADNSLIPPRRMPPIEIDMSLAKANFLSRFTIPCEDSEESRSAIKELSGKVNAERRKKALHRKGNAVVPTYDISFWLPSDNDGASSKTKKQWEDLLSAFVSSVRSNLRCEARQIGNEFVNSSGRRARAFRMSYWYEQSGRSKESEDKESELSNEEAKAIHREVYTLLPTKYPGLECR